MVNRPGLVIAGLLLAASALSAQEVKVEASVDSTRYRIGDWITVRVTASAPPGVGFIAPLAKDTLGSFEILQVDSLPLQTGESGQTRAWNLRLITFEEGEQEIPPIEFGYTMQGDSSLHKVSAAAIPLTITGVEVDSQGDIKDIKPPLDPPWAFEDVFPYLILILILAAAAGVYYYYRWRKRRASVGSEEFRPLIPPHELALGALRELEDKRLWQQGMIKEYYSEVTEIVRRFFEGRLGIVALEMTSDEILQQLKPIPEAHPLRKEINTFFLTADLVKFAKYMPTAEDHENELRWGYDIVRSMVPKPVSETEGKEVGADVR